MDKEHDETLSNRLRVGYHLALSLIGSRIVYLALFLVGSLCIALGLIFVIHGFAGQTNWTASVLDLARRLNDAVPGAVLLSVGALLISLFQLARLERRVTRQIVVKAGPKESSYPDYLDYAQKPLPDSRTVELLVSSTRKLIGNSFSDERSSELNFAGVQIRIPEEHRIGKLERPQHFGLLGWTIYKQAEDDQKHFVLTGMEPLNKSRFVATINSVGRSDALIFVHGFNNTFDESAFRLAQIVWDTQFKGVPILFAWPSKGGVLSYLYDRESAMFSVDGFLELLRMLQRKTQVSAIHIIAHSMGGQVVMESLSRFLPRAKSVGEIVLAAPDVDWNVFESRARRVRRRARGVTLYASSMDKALVISRRLAKMPRAGDVRANGPIVVPNVDSIDVTAVGSELFGLAHNTFAAKRSLIDDIGRLILTGHRPPHQRSPQIRGMPDGVEPPTYWRYAD